MANSQSTTVAPAVEYRSVPGLSAYRVGNDGSVQTRVQLGRRSHLATRWRPLSPQTTAKGYRRARLVTDDHRTVYVFVHVLVLTAFVGPKPEGKQTRHLNGDPADNRLVNLTWGTNSQNTLDRKRHGTFPRGPRATWKRVTRRPAKLGDRRRIRPLLDRLLDRVQRSPSGCWVWMSYVNDTGYGKFTLAGQGTKAVHRLVYSILCAPIPRGMCVCHTCDNPPCCNPAHLFLGTKKHNTRDMWAKGRAAQQRAKKA